MILLARVYANIGRLAEANIWCGKGIALDKLNAENYYLLAAILLELSETGPAEHVLKQAIYVDHRFAPAYFALGNIARSHGKNETARRHFENALDILSVSQPEEILPGSEGMTVGRLMEIIRIYLKERI